MGNANTTTTDAPGAAQKERTFTLEQYVIRQLAAGKRGQWLWNDIAEFTEEDMELMWDFVRQLVLCKGLAEAIDAVSGAARVIRKQHPDEETRDKASRFETALDDLSEEVGYSFGTR
jgi:hypothetical protein